MQRKEFSKIFGIIMVLFLQTIIILWLSLNVYIKDVEASYEVPVIALRIPAFFAIILSCVSVRMTKRLVEMANAEIESELYRVELQRSKELIDSLRAQRHDFYTYLSVLMGLIQLGKTNKAIDYISDVAKNLQEIGSIAELEDHSILNALIVTKKSRALEEGFTFTLKFQTALNDVKISEYKLSRILGNIIDNAIDALKENRPLEPRLEVTVERRENTIVFSIWNNGPPISKDKICRIFESGYTTKDGDGHGLGLSIVKTLVSEMGGTVDVTSDLEEGTCFTIAIPFVLLSISQSDKEIP